MFIPGVVILSAVITSNPVSLPSGCIKECRWLWSPMFGKSSSERKEDDFIESFRNELEGEKCDGTSEIFLISNKL